MEKIKYNNNKYPSPLIIHTKQEASLAMPSVQRNPSIILRCRRFSRTMSVATPKARVNITLCVPSALFCRYQDISLIIAKLSRERNTCFLYE